MLKLPYGRNSDRSNFLLVPIEKRGACSSKHALLAAVAQEHHIPISLMIGIFLMSAENTPKVAQVLGGGAVKRIPEAHCYLRFGNTRYDFTSFSDSVLPYPSLEFIHEEAIAPDQIGEHKISLHRAWLDHWRRETCSSFSVDELWSIREKCISMLSSPTPEGNSRPSKLAKAARS